MKLKYRVSKKKGIKKEIFDEKLLGKIRQVLIVQIIIICKRYQLFKQVLKPASLACKTSIFFSFFFNVVDF